MIDQNPFHARRRVGGCARIPRGMVPVFVLLGFGMALAKEIVRGIESESPTIFHQGRFP
jgi:hypothetical protein